MEVRLCSSAHSSFDAVVTIAKLRTHSPAGERQFSHSPASAIRSRSASAMAKGCFPAAVRAAFPRSDQTWRPAGRSRRAHQTGLGLQPDSLALPNPNRIPIRPRPKGGHPLMLE
jgi:hypothetical protein